MKLSLGTGGGRGFALFLGVLVTLSMAVGGVAAANAAVNYNASATQSQYYSGDVSIDTYQMQWDGLQYEDDSGNVAAFPGSVNASADNPYSYLVTRANVSDFGAFPHSKDGVSALEASEWTTSGASVSNAEPASGVEAVQLTLAQNDTATFSNFSITSDEAKKTLFAALDVNALDSGAEIEFRVNDTDGDYKVVEINTTRSSGDDLIANATGDGYVLQQQLGSLSTQTTNGSDGTFDNIQSVEVVAVSNGATITVTGLNLDKTGTYTLGEKRVNTDGDNNLETKTIIDNQDGGPINIHDLGTLGATFDGAALHDLSVAFERHASTLPSADVSVNFSDAGAYPSFDFKVDIYYRMSLPTAYDLSYSNLDLMAEQALPDSRYQAVEMAEGVGDTDFKDVSYSSVSSQLAQSGDTITVDSTVQPGQQTAIHYQYLITGSEKSAMQSTGGLMGPTGGSGGWMSTLFSLPVIGPVLAALLGLIGFRSARG